MDKFKASILEYLGKIEDGILVLISIIHEEVYYESTFYYTDKDMVLTIPEDLELKIGHKIIQDEEYPKLIKYIIKKVVPYKQIYNNIDFINFNRWILEENIEDTEE